MPRKTKHGLPRYEIDREPRAIGTENCTLSRRNTKHNLLGLANGSTPWVQGRPQGPQGPPPPPQTIFGEPLPSVCTQPRRMNHLYEPSSSKNKASTSTPGLKTRQHTLKSHCTFSNASQIAGRKSASVNALLPILPRVGVARRCAGDTMPTGPPPSAARWPLGATLPSPGGPTVTLFSSLY